MKRSSRPPGTRIAILLGSLLALAACARPSGGADPTARPATEPVSIVTAASDSTATASLPPSPSPTGTSNPTPTWTSTASPTVPPTVVPTPVPLEQLFIGADDLNRISGGDAWAAGQLLGTCAGGCVGITWTTVPSPAYVDATLVITLHELDSPEAAALQLEQAREAQQSAGYALVLDGARDAGQPAWSGQLDRQNLIYQTVQGPILVTGLLIFPAPLTLFAELEPFLMVLQAFGELQAERLLQAGYASPQ